MLSKNDDFDWSLEDPPLVGEQLSTTIYGNNKGQIVIRQRDDGFDDGDTLIFVTPRNAEILGHALIEMGKEMTAEQDAQAAACPAEPSLASQPRLFHEAAE
jgi:hypothetical protein